jgi:glycerol-3-phosphate acyltransferase PlsY
MAATLSGLAIGVALGAIPFAWLLHRLMGGRDLRAEGSGNPGATNLSRAHGIGWGIAAALLDAAKGAAAVLAASRFAGADAMLPAGAGAVLGHIFTPWLSGRGGKGIATTAGAFAILAPAAAAAATAVFAVLLAVTRVVSVASVAAAVALPAAMLLVGPKGRTCAAAAAIAVLIAWRHRANFARMRAGTEPKLGGGAPSERGG